MMKRIAFLLALLILLGCLAGCGPWKGHDFAISLLASAPG